MSLSKVKGEKVPSSFKGALRITCFEMFAMRSFEGPSGF